MDNHLHPLFKSIMDSARRRPMFASEERNEAREEQILDRERDERRERLDRMVFDELIELIPLYEFNKLRKQVIDLILDQEYDK